MTPLEVARRRLAILEGIDRLTPDAPPEGIDVTALRELLARREELLAAWPPEDPPEEEPEIRAIMTRVRDLAAAILARDRALTVVLADAQRRVLRVMRRSGGGAAADRDPRGPGTVSKVL